jgi:DNA-binding SARP family transcriptional activator
MKQDYPSAERLLVQAEKMDTFIDKIYFYLGTAYAKNNRRKEACDAFRQSEQRGDQMLTADLIKYCK